MKKICARCGKPAGLATAMYKGPNGYRRYGMCDRCAIILGVTLIDAAVMISLKTPDHKAVFSAVAEGDVAAGDILVIDVAESIYAITSTGITHLTMGKER